MDIDIDDNDDGFNLIQPSLFQQIKNILDQYPDDGQILKVKIGILFEQEGCVVGK